MTKAQLRSLVIKYNKRLITVSVFLLLFSVSLVVYIDQNSGVPIYKSDKKYAEVMAAIQNGLINRGYKIEAIQPIDRGLKKAGYNIPTYRVVFYYPEHDLAWIQARHPHLSALLPLSIIVAKRNKQLLVTGPPYRFLIKHTDNPILLLMIKQWQSDSNQIIKNAL